MWQPNDIMRWQSKISYLLLLPIKEFRMLLYFFLTLQPLGHLGDFILVVAHTIFILCEIDVETFCLLGIVVVSGAE